MPVEAVHNGWVPSQCIGVWILIALSIIAVIAVTMHAPIAQPLDYHAFADRRTLYGIPNFWNVISNVPFLTFGAMGVAGIARRKLLLLASRRADARI